MNLINQAKGLNLDKIVGLKLLQVCIGLYQIILNFEGQLTIEVGDSIILTKEDKIISKWNNKNGRENLLIGELLELKITGFVISENYLELSFEEGYNLRILSSEGHFESFIIMFGTQYYVFT